MTFQTIECEVHNGILILRHNREDRLNARNSQMYVEIMATLRDASRDDSVAAVVLTAKGRFFSAGMDFNNQPNLAYDVLPSDSDSVREVKNGLPQRDEEKVSTWPAVKFVESFINFEKPLIGAVNGPAIGEGFTSLLHCDVVYAADSAYFWAPFARAGVAPEFCSTHLMPQKLGPNLAHAALYLGQRITAEQARAAGFVQEIFPSGENFEEQVLTRTQQGLELAGPPELRAKTLQAYKQLLKGDATRDDLNRQSITEFELIRDRGRTGETELVQKYYQSLLPNGPREGS